VKQFFNEKEVTSTLVMDALYSGCKQIEEHSRAWLEVRGLQGGPPGRGTQLSAVRGGGLGLRSWLCAAQPVHACALRAGREGQVVWQRMFTHSQDQRLNAWGRRVIAVQHNRRVGYSCWPRGLTVSKPRTQS
jgi:hypothetical protein